jgi:hypothetical protein
MKTAGTLPANLLSRSPKTRILLAEYARRFQVDRTPGLAAQTHRLQLLLPHTGLAISMQHVAELLKLRE